jgi:serine protease Do
VDDVMPNGAADKAGIKSGDVIIAFNGKPVMDGHDLQLNVSDSAPGSSATVKLIRNGATKTLNVTLGELPKEIAGNSGGPGGSDTDNSKTDALDGVTVSDLDKDTRQQLRIPDYVQGALVDEVAADSHSADAGMRKNDVIVEINRQSVTDAENAVKLCEQATGDQILVKVWRRSGERGGTHYLSVDNTKTDSKTK